MGSVAYHQRYHDLIVVPWRDSKPGIYWLRLYRHGKQHVAVVTEVPGNPGLCVTNAIKRITRYLTEHFGVEDEHLVLFEVWPSGALEGIPLCWSRVDGPADNPVWGQTTRAAVEAIIGGALDDIPEHDNLYARVGDRGGHVWQEQWRKIFVPMPVTELPSPHNPSGCAHAQRFDRLAAAVRSEEWAGEDRDSEAGRRFLASLTAADRTSCRYHNPDWKAIADESVRILEQLGHCDTERYTQAARRSSLGDIDRGWLVSLFRDPIRVGGGGYSGGQHRGCALRFSGAQRAAIHVDEKRLADVCDDWTYLGGG
jgi:hypothetical protein